MAIHLQQNGVAVPTLPLDDLTPGDIWEISYERAGCLCNACYFVDENGALCGPWATPAVARRMADSRGA